MTRSREKQREQFRQLTVLIAVAFVDMIGFMLVLPVLPFYALNFGATPTQVGWILAAFSIAQLVSAPLWGRVSDRYGRRPALLIGLSAAAVAYVVFGFANSLLLLFLSRLVQGAGGGTTGVAQAYVADTVRPADRARALGWLSSASSAGIILGPILGTLASRLGTHAPGLIAAGLCVLNALFAWRWLPESKQELGRDETRPRQSLFTPAIQAFLHPRNPVSRLIWIYGAGMLANAALYGVLPVFLQGRFSVNERTFGYFLTYFGALSLVMRVFLLGPVVDRLGERGTMRLGCIALIAGFLLYPATHNIWVLAIGIMPLMPVGTALLFPSTTSLLSGQVSRAELGVTMGVAQTFAGVARSIGPVASNQAFQSLGQGWPFFLAAAVVGFVAILSRGVKAQSPALDGVTGETAIPT
ncbi:MAG TPA: MFS transporter [Gemmatimonadales bacterium]|jgi:MFS family permease|nr:MFS transporter [Gemmatimonadales bacterium]